MARPNVLKDLEGKLGQLDNIIIPLVNDKGQRGAAKELKVAESTICDWLMRNGYTRIVRYEKTEKAS